MTDIPVTMELVHPSLSHPERGAASLPRAERTPRELDESRDDELIRSLAAGRREALGPLFRRHAAACLRLLVRLGVAAPDAEDLLQTVFMELPRLAPKYDARFSAPSWILGIAAIQVRRHRRSLSSLAARLARFGREPTASPTPPDETLARDRSLRRLAAALEVMSHKKREVFVLVTLEGLSGDEVARLLDIPVNTVWTRLHHARAELRTALGEEGR